jgi:adenylate cyclase
MKTFASLLDALIAAPPDRRDAIEELILSTFQRKLAVLALDMSGFTLAVRRDGILAYLCQIRRMQKLTRPIVLAFGGEVVKNEADNLLAVFEDAEQAVRAALAIQEAVLLDSGLNQPSIAVSIGIDFGQMLLIDGVECFGDAVNFAYKLGEDIARPGETLITSNVVSCIGACTDLVFSEMQISISGVEVKSFAVTRNVSASGNLLESVRGREL